MINIRQIDKITNQYVVSEMNVQKGMLQTMSSRKLKKRIEI